MSASARSEHRSIMGVGLGVGALVCVGCGDPSWGTGTEASGAGAADEALLALPAASWRAQGPAPIRNGLSRTLPLSNQNPVTGAVQSVAPHPTNANVLLAGTINGGIWRTTNALAANPTWTPLTDFLPSLAIGTVSFERNNPQNLIAGTGCFSSLEDCGFNPPGRVLVSRNGGNSWTVLSDPLFASAPVSGAVIRGNVLVISYGDLARSTDGGATWTRISGFPANGLPFLGGIDELVEDIQNPNRLYLTQTFGGVYRSDNLGATWVNISQNDPGPGHLDDVIRNNASAAKIGVCQDGRMYVGVLGQLEDVVFVGYTRDGGASWTDMDRPAISGAGRPFFHFSVAGDRSNSSFVYVAGTSNPMRGDAGIAASGQSPSPQWKPLAGVGTPNLTEPHADSRDMAFDANLNLIEADDGGVFRRVRPRETTGDWFSLAGNMQDAEIHDIAYDSNARVVIAGSQDNGTIFQLTPGQLPWTMFADSDGGDVQVDVLSTPGSSIRYSSFQNLGEFTRTTYNASNVEIARTNIALAPVGGAEPPNFSRQFIVPFELNRTSPRRLVISAFQAVYESFDQGDTVTSLGTAGLANTMAYGHAANPDVLYAGAGGAVFVRLSAGAALAPTATPFPASAQDIVIDPVDFRRAYVTGPFAVFVTPDAGSSWSNITGNLQSLTPGFIRTIEFIPGATRSLVIVGADRGVFATTTGTLGTWQRIGSNLPFAPVNDIQYSRPGDLLVAGLIGRGAWSVTGLAAP